MNRCLRWTTPLLLAWLLAGCATTVVPADARWFPREAVLADSRAAGRVALMVPPPVQLQVIDIGRQLRLQAGALVGQALLAALGDGLQGGVQQVDAPPSAGSGFGATLVIDAVQVKLREKLLWFVPLGYFVAASRHEFSTPLSVDLRLLDGQGQLLWAGNVEDSGGSLLWTNPSTSRDPFPQAAGRLAHEAAWRLAQRVLGQVREALAAERMKARQL